MSSITALSRRKKKRFEVRRRNKNETGLLPQSQARELFVIRVRGNHSLRWTTQRERNSFRRETNASHRSYTNVQSFWNTIYAELTTEEDDRLSQKQFRKVFKIQKNFYRCLPSQPSPEEKKKGFEVRKKKRERNKSPSSIASTGTFCYSRAWKPLTPMDDSEREILFDERPTQVTEVTRTCSPFGIPSMRNWPQRKMIDQVKNHFVRYSKYRKKFTDVFHHSPLQKKKKRF